MRKKRTKAELHAAASEGEPVEYWCSRCDAYRPKELFARCKKLGRQRLCREHHAAAMREYRARNAGLDTERYRTDPEYRAKVQAVKREAMRAKRAAAARPPCECCGAPESFRHRTPEGNVRHMCAKCLGAERYPEAQTEARAAEIEALGERWARLLDKHVGHADEGTEEA